MVVRMEKAKKRGNCGTIFWIIFLCFVVFAVVHCKRNYGVETEFDSVEEFAEYGGVILVDIPEGASDIKYYCNKIFVFGLESAYSFVINDEEEYDAFMETNNFEIYSDRTVEEYMVNPPKYNDAFRIRNWYGYVVEEDVKDYNVLIYDSFDGSYSAVIVDEESRRFVVIRLSTL